MVENLNQAIYQFNQDILKRELTAALIIKNQLQAIADDLVERYQTEQAKQLQKKILAISDESIKGMLHADSRENFLLQHRRLIHLLSNLKELAGEEDLDKALADYRFFHSLHHNLLDAASPKNIKDMQDKLPSWFKENPHYSDWKNKLGKLSAQTDISAFEAEKTELIDELLMKESYQNLANQASLALVEQNIHLLRDTRLAYLKETNSRKKLLTDLAWMGAGILLVAASAILSLAFPPLIIPGLVLGVAVLGYGVIDFSKESAKLYSEIKLKKLGEREISSKTMEELRVLEKEVTGLSESQFIERQELHEQRWSNEKKWVSGAGYAASFAGLGLALAGLALIIPGVGVPIAAIIAVTVVAVAVTAFAAVLLGSKVSHEQKGLRESKQQVARQMIDDEQMIHEIALKKGQEINLSSTAKIFIEEKITPSSIKQTAIEASSGMNDENERSRLLMVKQKNRFLEEKKKALGGDEDQEDDDQETEGELP